MKNEHNAVGKTVIDMDMLMSRLSEFLWVKKRTRYKVVENFKKNDIYIIHNITTEVINTEYGQLILFDDDKNILQENFEKVLTSFPVSEVLNVEEEWITGGNWTTFISFLNGTISIERLN